MVEHHLAKVGAAGSNPVSRFLFCPVLPGFFRIVLHFVLHSLEKMQHDRKNSNILGKIKTPGNLVVIRYPGVLKVLQ